MGISVGAVMGFGFEINDEAWDRIEELWNEKNPGTGYGFDEDRFWHTEQVLSRWPELELVSGGWMDLEESFAVLARNSMSETYGTGVIPVRLASPLLVSDIWTLEGARVALGVTSQAQWLSVVSYG